ncbi:MAG: DUF502 domain-containing protein [Endomicrobiales bacterium]|nr:DUF502 domain-containing protein [Endomicrobiales bacterium]
MKPDNSKDNKDTEELSTKTKNHLKRIPEYFVRGILFFIPLAVTVSALVFIFVKIDSFLGISVRGVGFLLTIVIITFLGYLTTNIFTSGLINLIDQMFTKIPFVKLVYTSIKDLIDAFVGKKKRFNRPVIVTIFPESGGKALGFITREQLENFGIQDHVVVYLPQSYNFAGQTLIFPKEKVQPLNTVSSTELMTFIVSAGIAGKTDMLETTEEK